MSTLSSTPATMRNSHSADVNIYKSIRQHRTMKIVMPLLLLLLFLSSASGMESVLIGAILPLSGSFAGAGFRSWMLLNQSISDLHTNLPDTIFSNRTFTLRVFDSGSTVLGATRAALQLESEGCVAILTGFEHLQIQNLTLLSTEARRIINQAATSTVIGEAGAAEGVAATGTSLIDAVTQVMHASTKNLPVLVPTSAGCIATTLEPLNNFVPLCTPPTTLASSLAVTFGGLGWTRFNMISQDSLEGSWNTRYRSNVFNSKTGLGEEGGGATYMNNDAAVADAIMHEVYGTTNSRVKQSGWPFQRLKRIVRYRLPSIPSTLSDAITKTLAAIVESRLYIIVVLLTGDVLHTVLEQAFLAGMLGADSPYVWIGIGENARRGGNSGIIVGTGSFASRGLGPGLCSTVTAEKLATFQYEELTRRVANGEITSTGAVSASSTTVSPTLAVDNPVVRFATSNPLVGTMCLLPAIPHTTKWANLRHRLIAGGLPSTTILDPQDGATYDSILLLAHALSSSSPSPSGASLATAIKKVRFEGVSSTWSFNTTNGQRNGLVDLVNFEQLSSGALYNYRFRATFSVDSGTVNFTESPIIFATSTPEIPPDFISEFEEDEILSWSMESIGVGLQIALTILASANVGMHLFKARKFDPSLHEQRSRHLTQLFKASLAYGTLILLGSILVGFIFLDIPSQDNRTTQYDTGLIFMAWIVGIVFVWIGLAIAGSQNGSKVGFYKSDKISRYEIAGKSGIAGGGGGSGVNFISSESSGTASGSTPGLNSHVSHIRGGGVGPNGTPGGAGGVNGVHVRNGPYGSLHSNKRSLERARMLKQPIPLWNRALEEFYITCVLFFTSWRMILGGLFLAASHELIFQSILSNRLLGSWIYEDISEGTQIGQAFWLWFLHGFGLTILLRETRQWKQVIGVLWLTFTNVASFYTLMNPISYRYITDGGRTSRGDVTYWSSTDVSLMLFICVAIVVLNNLALVIDIWKLSRGTLDQVLISAKMNLSKLEGKLEDEKERTKGAKGVSEYMRKILELINLIRPLHRNHALAFALADVNDAPAVGGRKRLTVIPPCFDQNERAVPHGPPSTGILVGGHHHHASPMRETSRGPTSRLHRDNSTSKLHAGTGAAGVNNNGSPSQHYQYQTQQHNQNQQHQQQHQQQLQPQQQMVLPGSRPPSLGPNDTHPVPHHTPHNNHSHITPGPSHQRQHSGGGVGGGVASSSPLTGYESLDFNFLSRAKVEPTGLKLLTELSERLFLASGPVHHRAVADIHLTHILSHPIAIELFKDCLQHRPSQLLHLALYLDIQRWKSLESQDLRRMIGLEMMTTFLITNMKDSTGSFANAIASGGGGGGGGGGGASGTSMNYHITTILPATKDAVQHALSGSSHLSRHLFDKVETELLYQLSKEMSNFQGTTSFKIVALVLGHAAYQPDVRISTVVRGRVALPASRMTGGAVTAIGGGVTGIGVSKGHSHVKDNSSLNHRERDGSVVIGTVQPHTSTGAAAGGEPSKTNAGQHATKIHTNTNAHGNIVTLHLPTDNNSPNHHHPTPSPVTPTPDPGHNLSPVNFVRGMSIDRGVSSPSPALPSPSGGGPPRHPNPPSIELSHLATPTAANASLAATPNQLQSPMSPISPPSAAL